MARFYGFLSQAPLCLSFFQFFPLKCQFFGLNSLVWGLHKVEVFLIASFPGTRFSIRQLVVMFITEFHLQFPTFIFNATTVFFQSDGLKLKEYFELHISY